MSFQPLTPYTPPSQTGSSTGSFHPLSTKMSTNPGYVAPKQVATPVVGKPISPISKVINTAETDISNVIKGINLSFVQPTLNAIQKTLQPSVKAPTMPLQTTKVSTPVVGKPLQSLTPDIGATPSNSSAQLTNKGKPENLMPQTMSLINQLSIDPYNLKANPLKALSDAWDSVKQPILDYVKSYPIVGLNIPPNSKTGTPVLGQISDSIKLASTPLTALFTAVNDVPVLGSVSKLLVLATTAFNEAPTPFIKRIVNSLYTKGTTKEKNNLTDELTTIVGFAANLIVGSAIGLDMQEKVATRFGEMDMPTIVAEANKIALTANRDLISRVIRGQGSSEDLRQYNLLAKAGLLRSVAEKPGIAGLLTSGENKPQDIINTVFQNKAETTPEGKALIKVATQAQQAGKNIEITKEANRPVNEANTEKIVTSTLNGERETERLDQPKNLEIAKNYQVNNLPKDATPETSVTVYRASNETAVKTGDHVTLSKDYADSHYLPQREGSKIITAQVQLKDLVRAGGLKSEFIYAPKSTPPLSPTVGVVPSQAQSTPIATGGGGELSDEAKQIVSDVSDALYAGDTEEAKALHDAYTSAGNQLPSFESMKAEMDQRREAQVAELDNIKAELQKEQRIEEKNNPDDPTNQLLDIADTLRKHFNAPGAKWKVTGNERTYTSVEGYSMKVGGRFSDVVDRLFDATDIEGFKKNIKILSDKFDKNFTEIYGRIQSGAIDGGDYDKFKERLSEENSKLQTTKSKGSSIAENKSAISQTSGTENRNTVQSSTTEGAVRSNESSDLNAGNAENANTIANSKSVLGNTNAEGSKPTPSEQRTVDIGEPEKEINLQRGAINTNAKASLGLKEFFEQDIQPAYQAVKEIQEEWRNVINPPNATKATQGTGAAIMKAKATIRNYQGIMTQKYKKYLGFFNKYSDQQNIANISQFERTGTFAVEPKAQKGDAPYSELYKKSMEESYKVLTAAYGKDTDSLIENYVRRQFIFDSAVDEAKGDTYLKNYARSLSANKSPLKHRVLDMPLDEALQNMKERGIKVKPSSTNPEALRQWSMVNATRAMAYKEAWDTAKESKYIQFVRNGGDIPDGLVALQDRAAQVFAPAEVHFGNPPSETGYQTIQQVGKYYAVPDVARIFNNAISTGLEQSATYKGFRAITNTMSQFQLGLSAFHFGAVGIDAAVTDLSVGVAHLIEGHPIKGFTHAATSVVPFASFFKDMYKGKAVIDGLKTGDPVMEKFLQTKLNPAGGSIGLSREYQNRALEAIQSAIVNSNPIGAVIRTAYHLPSAVIQLISHPLLGYAVPRVKIGAFMSLSELKLSRLGADATDFERTQALKSAWQSVDNRMGQLTYDNLFWNKIIKDISMMSVRSVGWDYGTLAELGGGAIDIAKLGGEEYNTTRLLGSKGVTDRAMWGLMLVGLVAFYGAVYQYAHTGEWPQTLKDYFHPRNGLTDANGNPDRRSLPTYLKDVFAYTTDFPFGAAQTMVNKSSPLLSVMGSLISNKDYYGNLIRNPNDPAATQYAQIGQWLMRELMPFSVQQAANAKANKGSMEQQLESFIGIIKAPATVIQSDQQKAIIKAYQNKMGLPSAKTPEQVEAANLKTQAYKEIKEGMGKNSPAYRQLIKNGTLNTARKQALFLKNGQLTGIERMQKTLPKPTTPKSKFNNQFIQKPKPTFK